jgi:hypothetical protein
MSKQIDSLKAQLKEIQNSVADAQIIDVHTEPTTSTTHKPKVPPFDIQETFCLFNSS